MFLQGAVTHALLSHLYVQTPPSKPIPLLPPSLPAGLIKPQIYSLNLTQKPAFLFSELKRCVWTGYKVWEMEVITQPSWLTESLWKHRHRLPLPAQLLLVQWHLWAHTRCMRYQVRGWSYARACVTKEAILSQRWISSLFLALCWVQRPESPLLCSRDLQFVSIRSPSSG